MSITKLVRVGLVRVDGMAVHPNHSSSNHFILNILGNYFIKNKKRCLISSKFDLFLNYFLFYFSEHAPGHNFFLNFSLLLNKLIISTFFSFYDESAGVSKILVAKETSIWNFNYQL